MRILIIDPVCNKPYDPAVLASQGLGGTESTVVGIAEALKALGHCVTVAQHNRSWGVSGYVPHTPGLLSQKWDTIVVLRDASLLSHIRAKKPTTPLFLWCHDLPDVRLGAHGAVIRRTRTRLIGVSRWHQERLLECVPGAEVDHVYNPVGACVVSRHPTPKKLAFTSSPHKGLELALKIFGLLRNRDAGWSFHVFNPGYLEYAAKDLPGVMWRGSVPHSAVLNEVADCTALLHPNTVFPETMGIVTAEANAVGTPVLCHALGATPEIVNGSWQLVDCLNTAAVLDTLELWHNEKRRTTGKPEFTLTEVMKRWATILGI